MIKTEVSLGMGAKPKHESSWDSLRSPDAANEQEQNHEHESVLQRIKRIITTKAEEFMQRYAERRQAKAQEYEDYNAPVENAIEKNLLYYDFSNKNAISEMMAQLPREKQERVKFIKGNLDLFQDCPSVGRTMMPSEAIAIYDDYREYIEDMPDDERPKDRLGVLGAMSAMLEGQLEAAEASGDEEARVTAGRHYDMILDLEAVASIPEYRKYAQDITIFGSRREFNAYIRDKILREGYAGTQAMNAAEHPVLGGAQSVEKVFKALDLLNSDKPIEEIWSTLEADENEGAIDWDPIEAFSLRGHELHTYVSNKAESQRAEAEAETKAAQKEARANDKRRIAEALSSDTPTSELPEDIKQIIVEKKYLLVADRLHGIARSDRAKVERLRAKGPLDADLRAELAQKGFSRLAYAAYLKRHAEEMDQKGLDVDMRRNLDDRRIGMIMRQTVSRADLAEEYLASANTLDREAQKYRRRPQEFSEMFGRSEDDFASEVLMAGQEGFPSYSEEVEDYLRRNFRFSIAANYPIGNQPGSLRARHNGLKYILNQVKIVASYDYTAARPAPQSMERAIKVSLEQETSMPSYAMDNSDYLLAIEDPEHDPDLASHRERHEFVTKQVIPELEANIRVLEERMAGEANAAELRPAA